MKTLRRITVLIFGFAACSSITEPERDLGEAMQTDRLSYSFTEDGGIYTTPAIELEL